MRLILVRHAQTNYNVMKLANADPSVDVHLSDEGIRQAENLAQLLKPVAYDVCYISELPRTRQTAEIINKYHNKELIVDRRLNDNKSGFESKPVADYLRALEATGDIYGTRLNDGESLDEAAKRAYDFLDELKQQSYSSVLVVTHGFITEAVFAYIEHKSLQEAAEFNLVQGTYAEFEL